MSSSKTIEVCSVAPWSPETPTSSAATSLSLTFSDIMWLKLLPVKWLFFYEFPHPPSSFFDSLLPKLKHSLSLTLHAFLPLASTLTWPSHSPAPTIACLPGDDGVSFTVAESDSDFNYLSGFDFPDAAETRLLVPHLTISEDRASVMALQVTLFPNSGFSIGITTHHGAMDGKSFTSFMNSWAYICFHLQDSSDLSSSPPSLPEHLVPFYDRSVIKDPCGVAERFANFLIQNGGPNKRSLMLMDLPMADQSKLKRGTFELTPSSISKLKKSAESKVKQGVRVSSFIVACAYVLECLVKAEKTEENRVLFTFGADLRSRLDPPVPPTYFGNCLGGAMFVFETKRLMEEDGFVCGVEGISEGLKKMEEEEDLISEAERVFLETGKMMRDKNVRSFTVDGSHRFDVYGNDFGWGRPKKMEIVSIDETGAISLTESRNKNGGIEIGLVLNQTNAVSDSRRFQRPNLQRGGGGGDKYDDLVKVVQSFFVRGFLLKDLNRTFITLIPKIDVPEKLKDFRPISLCNVILKAQKNKELLGVRFARRGPVITHLMYADDTILFFKADDSNCAVIKAALDMYGNLAGQKLNSDKLFLVFSPNTPATIKDRITHCFGVSISTKVGRYLGTYVDSRMSDTQNYRALVEKGNNKLVGWKALTLSQAGRLTLIKAVLQPLNNYQMSHLVVPKKYCHQMDAACSNFFWGFRKDKPAIHLLNKNKIFAPKDRGASSQNQQSLEVIIFQKPGYMSLLKGRFLHYSEAIISRDVAKLLSSQNVLVRLSNDVILQHTNNFDRLMSQYVFTGTGTFSLSIFGQKISTPVLLPMDVGETAVIELKLEQPALID
ncbi:phenolic glucoside malonyltransferase 1-like [Senna tora]|uniref:Phenolic glucoside malonyltransferase 1-like n=1 Tax=Senna tora TaxID=362788 RepID=A0A834WBM1_9FABA|nr:phenolic glucoside malonyltransferase 1-like [Senna tora]